jgi:hypothetical protein
MSDKDHEPWERDLPPLRSRGKSWLRVMLWLMPSGFAILSMSAPARLRPWGIDVPSDPAVWFWAILVFTIGTGIVDACLAIRVPRNFDATAFRVVVFVSFQALLIPLMIGLLLFAMCVANPLKI